MIRPKPRAGSALLGLAALIVAALTSALPARAQSDQQALVDRSTLAVQEIVSGPHVGDLQALLQQARAVMICPRIFRAGFFFGGEGGNCVLVARAGGGSWSYPAFYTMGGGSFGLQIGIQDSQLMMVIRTDRGLNAVINSQFKIGADAGIAIATVGAGLNGSTSADLGADIVIFSLARGLYGGISLNGSLMSSRSGWDQSYYGTDAAPRQIVIDMQARNPGADPLREVLTRLGAPGVPAPIPLAGGQTVSQGAGPALPPPGMPAPTGAVQQQNLPPPKS